MRIEFKGQRAALYLNDHRSPSLIVNDMKGDTKSGTIGCGWTLARLGTSKT
jgi:hypothetical protein